ncbi:MAG: hypothetical protein D6711_05325 [Chloroflexi bacterium]|nr:MAG: hypothetical protein D6711_05325 [Chloroflexota bacterium]
MRIQNNYSEKVYWRAFKGDDPNYVVGLNQGEIEPGATITWRDDSFPKIKVEIKTGDIVFSDKVLARAGQIFNMTDDLVVSEDGNLDVAKLHMKNQQSAKPIKIKTLDWVDGRNFNATQTREVVSRISTALASSQSFQQAHEHSQTWTVGSSIGGTIGKKQGDAKAKVDAEVSVEFQDKVVDKLQDTYSKQVTSVWENSVKNTYPFEPGYIYGIEVIWSVAMEEGTVSYFGEETTYRVVTSSNGSLTTVHKFTSPDEMPADLRKDFDAYKS